MRPHERLTAVRRVVAKLLDVVVVSFVVLSLTRVERTGVIAVRRVRVFGLVIHHDFFVVMMVVVMVLHDMSHKTQQR